MRLSDQLADSMVAHNIDVMRFAEGVREKVVGQLEELSRDIQAIIEDISPTSPKRQTYRIQRLERLLDQTNRAIGKSTSAVTDIHRRQLQDFVTIEGDFTADMLRRSIGIDILTVSLVPAQLKTIVSDHLIQGAPSREWWLKQSRDLRAQFAREMRLGVLQGETMDQLVRRVIGGSTGRYDIIELADGKRRRVAVRSGGIMSARKHEAEALVRTSVQTAANDVGYQTFRENTDIIKGLQALATLDARTTLICMGRDGAVWDIETGEPLGDGREDFPGPPPWHFNCRTRLIPVTKSWEELGRDLEEKYGATSRKFKQLQEAPQSTRESMDGQVAGGLNYEDWLKTKPDTFQKEVLGLNRWQMWRNGQISSLRQLTDQSGRPLTIAELRSKF
jgi:SPP1 gp7 family putative phage head morphogenesis protein